MCTDALKKEELTALKHQISAKAFQLLLSLLGPMIDLIFDDKGDRVTTMMVNIFHNIIPHIRDKRFVMNSL